MAKVMTTSRLSRFQACYTVGLRVRLVTDQQTEEDCKAYMSKKLFISNVIVRMDKMHTRIGPISQLGPPKLSLKGTDDSQLGLRAWL